MNRSTQRAAKSYHFVGVGGVGMSALAQAALGAGHAVSGSDRDFDRGKPLDIFRKLEQAGLRLSAQDGSAVTPDCDAVVVSTAIEEDNPDVRQARRMGVRIQHRAECLADLTRGKSTVAITGTSGKSTVTGMVGWILEQAGRDPSVVNGAILTNWQSDTRVGNTRCGDSDLWVIEADESDRSLLAYAPDWAIVTNASADHFTIDETAKLFQSFVDGVKQEALDAVGHPELWRSFSPQLSRAGAAFDYRGTAMQVPLLGRHNAQNAWLAVMMCDRLGCRLSDIQEALKTFRGIHRRIETVGVTNGITVVDDYGHNPAKMRAAWEAAAPHYDRILTVWRPHGFGPLRTMAKEIAETVEDVLRKRDGFYVLPVYDAGGTADRAIGSEALLERLKEVPVQTSGVWDYEHAVARVVNEARAGDLVMVMGARDPELPRLARSILGALA